MKKKKKATGGKVLDLHGRTSHEIFDLVDRFLLNEVRKGLPQTKIMTGKGTGLVQKEVIRYLKKAGYHWSFEKSGDGRPNEGVLVIYLD